MTWPKWTDFVFAAFLLTFNFINIAVEVPVCLGQPVAPDSGNLFLRISYDWGLKVRDVVGWFVAWMLFWVG